ncbi:hypothetical protein [Bordetella avium]|uniref:hypothetical protein n=1 Tax=Bordetella avium TaxID=521 RepID=UPI000FD78CA9|nr:hypothetical protein [Bordetella avium]AZY52831.1 hypothetical protein C0J07_10215 [Bordetella avium]
MSNVRVIQRSFGGGVLSPEMLGRIDDVKYQSGLAACRNFVIKPQGPAENRPGFAFVREVKNSTRRTRLIPFVYSITQTMVIEMGAGYFRFHTNGGTLLDGDAPYEIANPYAEADLFDIHYVQSADVLTLVHPNYAPRELRRMGATDWQLSSITFSSPVGTPTGVSATSNDKGPDYSYSYVVTALDADGKAESAPSAAGTCTNNLFTNGGKNTIAWSAVSGASRYNVYKMQAGLYGYIGQTTGTSLVDDNVAPDLSLTPPIYDAVFSGTGEYPAAVSYFEQRRVFAGTINRPQNVWMTKSGTESAMSYSLPTRDDDRVAFRAAALYSSAIRHIVPLSDMLLLTSSGEWRVTSGGGVITPSDVIVRTQSYIGASNAQPVIVANTVIYGSARGGHVRELAYNWQANGFVTGDLSLRAAHLFDNLDIVDMAYAKAPQPVVWCVSSNGTLLGLTYVPEQQIGAWHTHDTITGKFESCAVVAEGNEDRLYVIVQRDINGVPKRYIERMGSRQFDGQEDAFFVDSGATYKGAPITQITSGLDHLEGMTVSILADGAVHPQRVVTDGAVTLEAEASTVHIGLPITAEFHTLPLAMQLDGSFGQGRAKNVNKLWLRVYRSSGIWAGPTAEQLTEVKQRTNEPYGAPPSLKSEEIPLVLSPRWGDSGQIFVRQADPLPLMIVSMSAEVALGA